MDADMYLPVVVRNIPCVFIFQPDGRLRMSARKLVSMGVLRVIAGPTACHLSINIRRPYRYPRRRPMQISARGVSE